jgi:hypothetical protein
MARVRAVFMEIVNAAGKKWLAVRAIAGFMIMLSILPKIVKGSKKRKITVQPVISRAKEVIAIR